MPTTPPATDHIHKLPNSSYLVETKAGAVLVNCPPETLKYLLAKGLQSPRIILLPPDIPVGVQLGSSGFIHQGINYASVEFLLYSNFFGSGGQNTRLITVTQNQAERLRIILDETINGPESIEEYAQYPWLKRECMAVGYYPPIDRTPTVDDLATITHLEDNGGELGEGITIQLEDDQFIFQENGTTIATIPTTITDRPRPLAMAPARPLLRHELTLQFLGGSDGFDPTGITTCFLAYLGDEKHPKATLFDSAAYLLMRLGNLGISPRQISEVVLSHLHEDHLAGLPELLLMGRQRVRLLTSDIVYNGLLRVLCAMLNLPQKDVAALFDYIPLNPDQPVTLEGRRFESIYALHSIPTLAIRVNGLYFSGDMRYDETWFEQLVREGTLSPERRDRLIHFADGAKVLVQDAGGGSLHTTITPELLKALADKGQRIILAHTSKSELPSDMAGDWSAHIEFAGSGHVSDIGKAITDEDDIFDQCVETMSACMLFARLPIEERIRLARRATLTSWKDGEVIVKDGEISDGRTYIVHSGLVAIKLQNGQTLMTIGRGSSLGERGALKGGARTNSLVASGHTELLSLSSDVFRPVAQRLGLESAFERADWLWQLPLFQNILWAQLLDLALDFHPHHYKSGEQLFNFGEPGYEAYMLVSGSVVVQDRHGNFLEKFEKPGELFGARSALFNLLRNASAIIDEDSELWALPSTALQRLQMVYPNILLHLRAVESNRRGGGMHTSELRIVDLDPP